MALVVGNKTFSLAIPNAASETISHNHDVGADGFLLVVCQMDDSVSFTGATYDGVSMTQIDLLQYGNPYSQDYIAYGLTSPSTGTNDLVVSFSGSQFNFASINIYSFTGSAGWGNFGSDIRAVSPHTQSITVSANSRVLAIASSTAVPSVLTVDGVSTTIEWNHNVNREFSGGLSAPILSAGSIDVTTEATANVSNCRVEILEAVGGVGKRRIIIC